MHQLDIVLPCYNPTEDWHIAVVEQFKRLKPHIPDDITIQLFIVNDGSVKNWNEDKLNYIRHHIPDAHLVSYAINRGKGYALRYGVAQCNGDYIIYTDIDFPYTTASMSSVFHALKLGADIVAGNRAKDYYDQMPKTRIYISKFLKRIIKLLLGLRFTDTQCGLKGFNQQGKSLFLSTTINRYLFDLEFIFQASKRKDIKMIPVAVELRNDIVFSRMNLKILISESLNFIKILFKRNA